MEYLKNHITKSDFLPDWIIPDPDTVERDATSPTDSYLLGVENAIKHRYKGVIDDPERHIYNLLSSHGGFVHDLKEAYSLIRYSEELKSKLIYYVYNSSEQHLEHTLWTNAPLQWIARRVGERALPGLHAIAMITGDWTHHNELFNWFHSEWLPIADLIAEKYHQTPRYITRMLPMDHKFIPHLNRMRDFLIQMTNDIFDKYPQTLKSYKRLSVKAFEENY